MRKSDDEATPGPARTASESRPAAFPTDLPNDQEASGRSFGAEELDALRAVLASGTLTSTKGSWVSAAEQRFAELTSSAFAVATSSGTSAVHAALAWLDSEPGAEVITTPITDMGALAPILYQGLIPVFADVDPSTGNVTPESVAAVMSDRTAAVIVTHLFGAPANVAALRTLADHHRFGLIEDCAQAFLAVAAGKPVGAAADVACYSLQQGKHATSGEGGFVTTVDPEAAWMMRRWVNKAWEYGASATDHDFLALNSRLSELQGAVAYVQLGRLRETVAHRRVMAERLSCAIADIDGIAAPRVANGDVHSFWRFPLLVDAAVVPGGPAALAAELKLDGIASAPRYIQKPAFECGVFRNRKTFGSSQWPFTLARAEALDYDRSRFDGAYAFLDAVLVLPWNERFEAHHVDRLADSLRTAVRAAAQHRKAS